MDTQRTYADHRADQARLQSIQGGDESLPDGPSLGLAGIDQPATADAIWGRNAGPMADQMLGPALVTAVDCETAASHVDDYRITIGKVLPDGWSAGTVLDAHVDVTARRVWLRTPHVPDATCGDCCACPHHVDDSSDPRTPIPGVDAVKPGAVAVQSRNRVKLDGNLLSLLGAERSAGAICATTVDDLDAVLLVGAGDYLRRLLPDLTAPTNVVQLHPNRDERNPDG